MKKAEEITFDLYHADNICTPLAREPFDMLQRMLMSAQYAHEGLIENVTMDEAKRKIALARVWHKIMALVYILRTTGRWDDANGTPR